MRKLFLTHFQFKTGDETYEEYRLTLLEGSECHGNQLEEVATDKAMKWFATEFPESALLACKAHAAIEEPKVSANAKPDSIMHGQWFSSELVPPSNKDFSFLDISDDVLIDLNGNRNHFRIGYYDKRKAEWILIGIEPNSDKLLDLKRMKWTYLPLAKYDKP